MVVSAATPAALTLSGFKAPAAINELNTGDVTLGCTYTAATPTLGLAVPATQGLEIDLGNLNTPRRCSARRDDRRQPARSPPRCSWTFVAQEVTFLGNVKANDGGNRWAHARL